MGERLVADDSPALRALGDAVLVAKRNGPFALTSVGAFSATSSAGYTSFSGCNEEYDVNPPHWTDSLWGKWQRPVAQLESTSDAENDVSDACSSRSAPEACLRFSRGCDREDSDARRAIAGSSNAARASGLSRSYFSMARSRAASYSTIGYG